MQITPRALEGEFTLATAATRLDFLSRRDNGVTTVNTVVEADADDWSAIKLTGTSLDVDEALELLALGEVVARKAHDSRLVGIRAALRGGASWEQIADALDVTPQEAWDAYAATIARSIESDELDAEAAASARELAGARPRG
jgi:alkylhydroperoxidase/carboxymuconolactone decarboxylase family protein YurZ